VACPLGPERVSAPKVRLYFFSCPGAVADAPCVRAGSTGNDGSAGAAGTAGLLSGAAPEVDVV